MPEQQHVSTETQSIPTSQIAHEGPTGGDILVAAMRAAGVDVAFGVISIHNLPLVEAVARDLRFVTVRHEAAAINAADGYARATRGVGVAITSTGSGAGNAAGAMLEALTAQSRVLHVTGNIESQFLGEDRGVYHEVPRQFQLLGSVSDHALRVESEREAAGVIAEALSLLETAPHGPVSVDWPIDLQYTADPGDQEKSTVETPQPKAPSAENVAVAAQVMREARRPLIWVGGGARRVGAAMTELAEAWGAGVLSGANGRGSVPEDHPLIIGNFAVHEELEALLKEADCLLTVGSHLRANETSSFQLPLPKNHVQIDLDPDAIGRNFPIAVGIQADARLAVPALLEALGQEAIATEDGWAVRVGAAADAARAAHRGDIGAYSQICDAMRSRLPRDGVVVRDVCIPGSSWGNRLLAVYDPTSNIYAAGGGIGQGLAQAIGAAIGRDGTPVLAMIGDGGLSVHLGEFATLATEQVPVIVTLFNDAGFGVLRNMQTAKDAPHRAVDLMTPDFALLCEAFGIPHAKVQTADEYDSALTNAIGAGGPAVIEVDVPALKPEPKPLVPPVNVP